LQKWFLPLEDSVGLSVGCVSAADSRRHCSDNGDGEEQRRRGSDPETGHLGPFALSKDRSACFEDESAVDILLAYSTRDVPKDLTMDAKI
jgi:hypothetical protein